MILWLLLFSIFVLLLVRLKSSEANEQLVFRYHECNENLGSFTEGSTYQKNRNAVLEKIYSDKAIEYGFYNFSYGKNPNKVNAMGLCRGDIKAEVCRDCLKDSTILLTERCKLEKEAIGYYDLCILRYSPDPIFGVMDTKTSKVYVINNANNTGVGNPLNQTLSGLLDGLKSKAAKGDSRKKFAEGSDYNDTTYALVQCTPDLSEQDCSDCLEFGLSLIPEFCEGKKGCMYLGPSCTVRHDISAFFEPIVVDAHGPAALAPQPPPLPPPPATTKGKSKTKETGIIAIVVSAAVVGILLVVICIYFRARKQRHDRNKYTQGEGPNEELDEIDNGIGATELLQFDFATITFATNNFSDMNKLGQGGFGVVYKGTLSDGHEVAIKRLSKNSKQGETEFKNEVLLTGKLQHRNLVKLLGFCLQRGERLLIYEFVPNKSLDYIINDPIKRENLNWEKRYKIIKGIGRGLLYLHEDSRLQVVHRDLKMSNILLDEELSPKISDFGIARLFDANQTQGNTKTVVGTFGYMAPEYIKFGHFSVKSDVFSFGVIILEIVCGRRNTIREGDNVDDLLSLAWKNWTAETTSVIVDPILLNNGSMNEIMRCIHIGLLCVQEEIANRPTMNAVLLMLNSTSVPLAEPSEPPFLMQPKGFSSIPPMEQFLGAMMRSSDSGSQPTQGSTSTKSSAIDLYPW